MQADAVAAAADDAAIWEFAHVSLERLAGPVRHVVNALNDAAVPLVVDQHARLNVHLRSFRVGWAWTQ